MVETEEDMNPPGGTIDMPLSRRAGEEEVFSTAGPEQDGNSLYNVSPSSSIGNDSLLGGGNVMGQMSETISVMASAIYSEFERMIGLHGEGVVRDLMPLVVEALESLHTAQQMSQSRHEELVELSSEYDRLMACYSREKQHHTNAKEKCVAIEDELETARKQAEDEREAFHEQKKKADLHIHNLTDSVARIEARAKEAMLEADNLRKRHSELMQRYAEDLNRMNAQRLYDQEARDKHDQNIANQERDNNIIKRILRRKGGDTDISDLYQPTYQEPSYEEDARSAGQRTPVPEDEDGDLNTSSIRDEMSSAARNGETHEANAPSTAENSSNGATSDSGVGSGARVTEDGGGGDDENRYSTRATSVTGLQQRSEEEPASYRVHRFESNYSLEPNSEPLFDELGYENVADLDNGADMLGMSKEVEKLIAENNQLQETKNALNVVKDDLIAQVDELTNEQESLRDELSSLRESKSDLQKRVSHLDSEVKRLTAEMEKAAAAAAREEEELEDLPTSGRPPSGGVRVQPRKFTKQEMARVLMERNQYKQRLLELQETVRWTEMLRASKEHPDLAAEKRRAAKEKSQSGYWKLFSGLFGSSTSGSPSTPVSVRKTSSSVTASPAAAGLKFDGGEITLMRSSRALSTIATGSDPEIRAERMRQKKEQMKAVKAGNIQSDDGRIQAYGWSINSKLSRNSRGRNDPIPVPTPAYSRPLVEKEPSLRMLTLWCAATVSLTGGQFSLVADDVSRRKRSDSLTRASHHESKLDGPEECPQGCRPSSIVWACSSGPTCSKVSIFDLNTPSDTLANITIPTNQVLVVTSVPGASGRDSTNEIKDRPGMKITDNDGSEIFDFSSVSTVSASQCGQSSSGVPINGRTQSLATSNSPSSSPASAEAVASAFASDPLTQSANGSNSQSGLESSISSSVGSSGRVVPLEEGTVLDCEKDGGSSSNGLGGNDSDLEAAASINSLPAAYSPCGAQTLEWSSSNPTVWLGCQNGSLFVHSAVTSWDQPLHAIKLPSSIYTITHISGRVLVGLQEGQMAVFSRDPVTREFDLTSYKLLDLGRPRHSIRCSCVVKDAWLWCGYRNKVHVIDPINLVIVKTFDAHPRKESQVRHLAAVGDGVWVSIRLESTLRLYHAHTFQHLQDIDIEPYVTKILGSARVRISFLRVSALACVADTLWIGTSTGVVISIPLGEEYQPSAGLGSPPSSSAKLPGGAVRVYSDSSSAAAAGSSDNSLPYCSMSHLQLSFHGHRNEVKFFVQAQRCVRASPNKPGVQPAPELHVMSGGQGYIDFRVGDREEPDPGVGATGASPRTPKSERSHIILWKMPQVTSPAGLANQKMARSSSVGRLSNSGGRGGVSLVVSRDRTARTEQF